MEDKFKGDLYFSHDHSNSCGVLTGLLGAKGFTGKEEIGDRNGQILI